MIRTAALAGLVLLASAREATAQVRALSMEEAVRLAMERNLDIRIEGRQVAAARARLTGASLLSQGNPEVEGSLGPRQREGRRTLDYDVQLLQPVEIGGQRGARIAEARAGVGGAEARVRARRVEVAAAARESFGRAQAAQQQSAIADAGVALARQALETAQQRFQAGDASRIEVNAARVELGRALREARLSTQRRTAALSDLVRVVGLEPDEEVQLSGQPLALEAELKLEPARLLERALTTRPDLAAARRDVEAARAETRLAAREAIPTPRIGASLAEEEGARIIQGVLSLPLPLFNRNQGPRGVAAARLSQAEDGLVLVRRRVQQDVRVAISRLRTAHAAARDFAQGVVMAAEENQKLIEEAYAAGKIDFVQLLLVRRETLDARRSAVEALQELNEARSELARAVGQEEAIR